MLYLRLNMLVSQVSLRKTERKWFCVYLHHSLIIHYVLTVDFRFSDHFENLKQTWVSKKVSLCLLTFFILRKFSVFILFISENIFSSFSVHEIEFLSKCYWCCAVEIIITFLNWYSESSMCSKPIKLNNLWETHELKVPFRRHEIWKRW